MLKRTLIIAAAAASLAVLPGLASAQRTASAVFAGGCFWTTEYQLEKIPGVISATSGFSGGQKANPTYNEVVRGNTGHLEAVRVVYDPSKVSYRQLADQFWRTIDPTDDHGQACDKGFNYRTAIFYANDAERQAALASKAAVDTGARKGRIVTQIRAAAPFYAAGPEHQDYAKRNPQDYARYARGCGRDQILARVWADSPRA
jgi:methionine-S-sulfoxide reductase